MNLELWENFPNLKSDEVHDLDEELLDEYLAHYRLGHNPSNKNSKRKALWLEINRREIENLKKSK